MTFKDFIEIILTAIGIIIAKDGLTTWKKQIKGTKEFEIAYDFHYSVLKLRDAIKHVRSPAIWNSESDKAIKKAREEDPDLKEEDIQKNAYSYVYNLRWEEITRAYTEVEANLLAAQVLWGSTILEKIRPLKAQVAKLNVCLMQYLKPEYRTSADSNYLRDVVYDQGNEENEDGFSREVSNYVNEIVHYIKQKLGN